jgi:hypothetical protein
VADLKTLLTDPETGPRNVMQAEAMRSIINAALLAGAVGIGGRTLQGLGNFAGRNLGQAPKTPLRQSTIPVPVPVDLSPPSPRRGRPRFKAAEALPALPPPAEIHKQPLTWLAQNAANALGTMKGPGEHMSLPGKALSGWGSRSIADKPWAYPVGAAAIGAGLVGGYKLTDWLLDRARKNEVDSELAEARKQYEAAMMGQYGQKAASVDPVDPVDALYDATEKSAGVVGPALGMGLLGMGAIGLGSGMASYNWARGRSRTRALEEAIRRRQEALFAQAPRPIMATPVPYPVGQPPPLPGDEEDDEKYASVAAAADQVLRRFQAQKQRAAQNWQTLINGPPKGASRARPPEPQAPRLPTLAGVYSGAAGGQPPA